MHITCKIAYTASASVISNIICGSQEIHLNCVQVIVSFSTFFKVFVSIFYWPIDFFMKSAKMRNREKIMQTNNKVDVSLLYHVFSFFFYHHFIMLHFIFLSNFRIFLRCVFSRRPLPCCVHCACVCVYAFYFGVIFRLKNVFALLTLCSIAIITNIKQFFFLCYCCCMPFLISTFN